MVKKVGLRHVFVMLAALAMAALACTPSAPDAEEETGQEEEVRVVTATPDPPEPAPPEPAASEGQTEDTSSIAAVRGRADQVANIREKPDPNCPIIGSVPRNQEINLLMRTNSSTEQWYLTDYLSVDSPGWVYHGPLTLLDDDGGLQRVPAEGCAVAVAPSASCGDGSCNAGETCQTCTADCGACPVAAGACPAGPGNCCGDGTCQTDEDASWCGDCGQVAGSCGNGACDAGENACTCAADCSGSCDTAITTGVIAAAVCGDGQCNGDENATSCAQDCGGGGSVGGTGYLCGDNSCDGDEDACSCPADCGGTCWLEPDPCVDDPLGPGCPAACVVLGTC
jgi:hypothetical protein